MHTNSKLLFKKFAVPYFHAGQRVLEVGPDFPSTFQGMLSVGDLKWETLDIYDSKQLTYPLSPLYQFPILDDTFDVVVSGQVMEHVPKIWRWLAEIARVTKKGGRIITIVPTSWPYHEGPNYPDCWRVFPEGFKALCEDTGLIVEEMYSGSLELPNVPNALPGRSPECQRRRQRFFAPLLRLLGVPVEKAFDTICIARKPD